MNQDIRKVIEGRKTQGLKESIKYPINTKPWGGTPTPVSLYVWDVSQNFLDVTATVAVGGPPTVIGDVITSQVISGLILDHLYRVEYVFTIATNTFSAYFELQCER